MDSFVALWICFVLHFQRNDLDLRSVAVGILVATAIRWWWDDDDDDNFFQVISLITREQEREHVRISLGWSEFASSSSSSSSNPSPWICSQTCSKFSFWVKELVEEFTGRTSLYILCALTVMYNRLGSTGKLSPFSVFLVLLLQDRLVCWELQHFWWTVFYVDCCKQDDTGISSTAFSISTKGGW
jgi:hypothetical protein